MSNSDTVEAWRYHNSTKHPGMPPHYLDWGNQPIPFKIYTTLEPIEIPTDLPLSGAPTDKAVSLSPNWDRESIPDLKALGRILFLSAGITKKASFPGGDIYFRAAPCTGALYHIDLYVVTDDIEGLEAGVYHFAPNDFTLRRLRRGNFKAYLAHATGENPHILSSPIAIICTSTIWRNSWKYQARTYRHVFWDNGTILANLLAASCAYGVPAHLVMGFIDKEIENLLGIDPFREIPASVVALGRTVRVRHNETERVGRLKEINYPTVPLSNKEVDYPSIRRMHEASSLLSTAEVRAWREGRIVRKPEPHTGALFPVEKECRLEYLPLEQTILKRGSTRVFARKPISFEQLSSVLVNSMSPISADFLGTAGSILNNTYLIVNDVEGIPKGAYYYRQNEGVLELIKEGEFREEAGYLGLGQDIPADASTDIFFLVDLKPVLEAFGNRGYRAAQIEGGILGGRVYLCAYGLGLGASGLTFFDDEVTDFFSPHAKGKSVMFLVAAGKSAMRRLRED
jgi:SagB-type dehydrogenase family enzyme